MIGLESNANFVAILWSWIKAARLAAKGKLAVAARNLPAILVVRTATHAWDTLILPRQRHRIVRSKSSNSGNKKSLLNQLPPLQLPLLRMSRQ